LSAFFALVLPSGSNAAAAGNALDISEARWLAPGADQAQALAFSPGECLRGEGDKDERFLVEAGRVAFRTPLLLGGHAARNGLSCNSCHRDGHDNADFFLEGLSSRPGSADVTSSLFSKSREDGVFNPVVIPTLVGAGDKDSFGTMAPQPSLHAFISSAVGDEFQGEPPPSTILAGLVAYIGHLDATACDKSTKRMTVRGSIKDVERALRAASEALVRRDHATAGFLLLAAQRTLLPVNERFAGDALQADRQAIEALARDLAAVRAIVSDAPEEALSQLDGVQGKLDNLSDRLHRHRRQSLYDLQVLKRAVEGARPGGN
jgi:hypothetical protein